LSQRYSARHKNVHDANIYDRLDIPGKVTKRYFINQNNLGIGHKTTMDMACMNILIKINRKYEKIQECIYVQKFRSVLLLSPFLML
jgi:hypothetical protein